MDKLKATFLTALVIAILLTPAASAQTAATISIVSGNGQMICTGCGTGRIFTYFYPMVVKVTDASGRPIAGKTVNWQLVTTFAIVPSFDTATVTDSNGLAVSRFFEGTVTGSASQPFVQSVVNASVDSVSVNFTETQGLSDSFTNNQIVFTQLVSPAQGTTLTGPAGSTGTTPIQIHIDGRGTPVPNVSVRILSPEITSVSGQQIVDPTRVSATCVTGPGADPGSVLTDANGNASCFPVFGPVAGSGPVNVLIGGLDPAAFDQTATIQPLPQPLAFFEYDGFPLVVTAVTPGRISNVSGNNQTVNPGAASAPLVVTVSDATGAVNIANQTVAWTVTAGAATLSQASSTTNSEGKAQTTVTFSPSATGTVTVRAALASNSGISTTFNLVTNVQIATFAKVSGDSQSTQAGQAFGAPLVVQVMGTNGQPVAGTAVTFSVTGSASLSGSSAITDGNGKAQISVTAAGTPGPVTITASIGNLTQTFSLTVNPPGPALSTASFYNPGGTTRTAALSPCALATVIAPGLAPTLQGLVLNTNTFGPWATTLASDTVMVNNVAAPIFSVGKVNGVDQLTFQVPCETVPAASVPIVINVGGGSATVNFPVLAASPAILETLMSDGIRRAVVVRPDGTFVSLQNPARRGEVVRVFVTGLGAATPALVTGALPIPGTDSLLTGQIIVGVNNAGARVVTSRVAPSLIGVYEVAFQLPSDAPAGNDVVLSVAVNATADTQTRFSNGSRIPIL